MQLIDQFNRKIDYIRVSVTDRCDFRCVYCMSEKMTFLPRSTVLSLEEIERVIKVFTELGVKKVRITGGEPLVRKDIDKLFKSIGRIDALDEITLTTNGSQLKSKSMMLKKAGVKRINISLDSLNPTTFKKLTRTGDLQKVLDGIHAAIDVGFDKVPEKDYEYWVVAFHGEDDKTLFRKDADKNEIKRMMTDPAGYCKVWREFPTAEKPKYWVVWPFSESKGWGERITGNL